MSRAVLLAALLGWSAVGTPAFAQSAAPIVVAQIPTMRPQGVRPEDVPEAPHRRAELECQSCHRGKHRGVLQMYLGLGGRGTPMIPSHMFQVRVECVACHMILKTEEAPTAVVGQTFRPSEQACLKCHGEKYRGMLEQWSRTLTRMAAVVAPKLAAARDALAGADPRGPKSARAGKLVDDAEFNLRYVTFAKGERSERKSRKLSLNSGRGKLHLSLKQSKVVIHVWKLKQKHKENFSMASSSRRR